jgi:hypothetical protein
VTGRKKNYEDNRKRYARLRKEGLCVCCAVKPAEIKYCEECRVRVNVNRSAERLALKIEVLSHYGNSGVLQCCWPECSVVDPDMLSLDHKENNGNEDRKTSNNPGGVAFYAKLKREGLPEGFQTLCHNHQWKKEILRRRADLNGTPSWREKE